MSDAVYVLDASVLIEASRRYYAFDIAPAFWEILVSRAEDGRVVSIDRVRDELDGRADELHNWARSRFAPWFAPTDDAAVLGNYHAVVNWVQGQGRFRPQSVDGFFRGADGLLVAYGLTPGHVVVTEERPAPRSGTSVKIPDVCQGLGVTYLDTFETLRRLDVRWT